MNISLEPFQEIDLKFLENWKQQIDSNLYMSRTAPKEFNGKTTTNDDLWRWYKIFCEGNAVGTIWIEKESTDSQSGKLGILLSAEHNFNKGKGRTAISQAIEAAKIELFVDSVSLRVRIENLRAIACYRHCGFKIISEGEK